VLFAYTFGDVMWSMFVFFLWILFFWLLFTVFADLFSRHDISGWGKTGWTILVIVLPFLGIFIYLIAEGRGMGERNLKKAQAQQSQMDAYVRSVASSDSATEQIAKGKELLDSGTITQAEFDQLKAKALAG
jgi:hypothetical protein